MLGQESEPSLRGEVTRGLDGLTGIQLRIVASVVRALHIPVEFYQESKSNLVDSRFAEVVANFLTLHHALHEEPFNKKPFEYLLKQCFNAQGLEASLNPTPGEFAYDVEGGGYRWSLKTEAAQGISAKQVKIEKFMEARWIRDCPDSGSCAASVREKLPQHMNGYDRILVLRAFVRSVDTVYRLEEIPKDFLIECFTSATAEMFEKRTSSKGARSAQSFGADFFRRANSSKAFRLLLDSSVEKVRLWYQVDHCIHHGTWVVPRGGLESLQVMSV